MDDSDIVSNLSSIADAPDHLETQYDPLRKVFKVHPHLLPSPNPPESNSDAMIKALKALQEKIRRLEVERISAADRLSHLERKTVQSSSTKHRHDQSTRDRTDGVMGGVDEVDAGPQVASQPTATRKLDEDQEDLQRRLEAIDRKFSQQAHELQEMREHFEEQSKSPPRYDTVDAAGRKAKSPRDETRRHFSPPRRFRGSSRDRVTRSESPIHTKKPLRRKKVRSSHKTSHRKEMEPLQLCQLARGKPQPGVHYRLDMRDVPFVAGTSLSPSHSVSANYQRVISLMKSHSPLLCGAAAASSSRKLKKRRCATDVQSCRAPPAVTIAELEVLLSGLEEELGELTFKHQQLAIKADSQPVKSRGQLQQLVNDLEEKAMQIDIVRRQIEAKRSRKVGKRASSSQKMKTRTTQSTVVEETGEESRGDFLRRMKLLQNTLQSDDLTWK